MIINEQWKQQGTAWREGSERAWNEVLSFCRTRVGTCQPFTSLKGWSGINQQSSNRHCEVDKIYPPLFVGEAPYGGVTTKIRQQAAAGVRLSSP